MENSNYREPNHSFGTNYEENDNFEISITHVFSLSKQTTTKVEELDNEQPCDNVEMNNHLSNENGKSSSLLCTSIFHAKQV